MSGYWKTIPRGIWKIVDSVDAINALNDPESMAEYDQANFRIHVLGPTHKAVILDLQAILDSLLNDKESYDQFIAIATSILRIKTLN